ncbi:MAG: SDR family NAD(P)-dependent oxidoreductase [Oscillochloridaceae bacterium umkhey_bin13]
MNPRGRVVLITGASAGIGAATARLFAAAGAGLVLAARRPAPLEALAASLPVARAIPTDVADPVACAALIEQTVATYGRLDILINNAGVGLVGPAVALPPAALDQALAVDLLGPLALMQAAAPLMQAQGRGQIINVSSVLAVQPLPYLGGYAAAKAALERLSEAARMELHGTGVMVSVVRPGTTQTGFGGRQLGEGRQIRRISPKGVPPEVVARTILRVAQREPRLAYVSLGDRLGVWLARLLPGLAEPALARAIGWSDEHDGVGA